MTTNLDISIDATHEILRERLDAARAAQHNASGVRDNVRTTDVFLASTSRHLAAASAILLPQARRHLPDGQERARELIRECRLLEVALNLVKARLYGEAHAVHRSWQRVWDEVSAPFERTLTLERRLVDDLIGELDETALDDLATRVYDAELHGPTRPHPFLPHAGVAGRVTRTVAARVDGFWDLAEGRMIPEPVHPDHHKNSLLEQYILADPHFDEERG